MTIPKHPDLSLTESESTMRTVFVDDVERALTPKKNHGSREKESQIKGRDYSTMSSIIAFIIKLVVPGIIVAFVVGQSFLSPTVYYLSFRKRKVRAEQT